MDCETYNMRRGVKMEYVLHTKQILLEIQFIVDGLKNA